MALLCVQGVTINTFDLKKKMYPLIYAGDVPNAADGYNSSISRYQNIDLYVIFPRLFIFSE